MDNFGRNRIAPEGQVYVCNACGKRSKDLYGKQKIDFWWDESCAIHAVLCYESSLEFKDGKVIKAVAVTEGKQNGQ